MKKLLLTIVVLFLGLEVYGQHFSNLPEKERNEKLIELARKEFKKKDCYLEYGIPEIKNFTPTGTTLLNGKDVGKVIYKVCFKYDINNNPNNFESEYACIVYISDKLGIAYCIIVSIDGGWGQVLI